MAAIPIGGDPEDYDFLRANPIAQPEVILPADAINFTYVGTFMPRSGPVVEQLFRAVAKLRGSDPALAARLRFNFIGTSNQPNSFSGYVVRPIAEALNIADLISETPQRVPYLEALSSAGEFQFHFAARFRRAALHGIENLSRASVRPAQPCGFSQIQQRVRNSQQVRGDKSLGFRNRCRTECLERESCAGPA